MQPAGGSSYFFLFISCVSTVATGSKTATEIGPSTVAQITEVGQQKIVMHLTRPKASDFTGYVIGIQKVEGLYMGSTREYYFGPKQQVAHIGELKPLTNYRITVWTRNGKRRDEITVIDVKTLGPAMPSTGSAIINVTSSWPKHLLMFVSLQFAHRALSYISVL